MENKVIKFALVGCGRISNQHLASASYLPDASLVAVCDIIEDRASSIAKSLNIDWYSDYSDLLKRDDIDVICLATPHGLHAPMAIEAAKSGKHVLMEKPLGLSTVEVREMFEVFKNNNKKIFPILQVRYNPPLQHVKKQLMENSFGHIHNAALVVRWTRPQEYYDKDEWRGTEKLDGPLLFSQGSHYVDILRWLFGPVKSVFAKKDTVAHRIETDDMIIAMIKFENGAYATLEFTLCTYPRNLECSLTFLGSRGTVKISGAALNEIAIWEVEGMGRPELAEGFKPNVYAGGLYQGSPPNHVYVYQAMINELKGINSNYISAQEAYEAIRFAEAIYKSANEGREVKMEEIN